MPEVAEVECRSKNSMVSKLLGVMGRKGARDRDEEDHKPNKKAEKANRKKVLLIHTNIHTIMPVFPKGVCIQNVTFPFRGRFWLF